MFEALSSLLEILNKFTPYGVMALLGTIILLLVHKKGPLQVMKDNHLSHVQASLDKLVTISEKQLELLSDVKNDISFLKGKID